MFHIFPTALATLFVAVGPVEVASMFLALTAGFSPRTSASWRSWRRRPRGLVLLAFAFGGIGLLALIDVGLPAFRTAGGVLLLMVAAELAAGAAFGDFLDHQHRRKRSEGPEPTSRSSRSPFR